MDTTGERPVPFPNDTQVPVDTLNTGPEDACVEKSVNNDMVMLELIRRPRLA